TPQQVRVLMMLSEGLLNKQIAYELSVSEATVKAHVSAILQKLGVESRTQAVITAAKIEAGQWSQVTQEGEPRHALFRRRGSGNPGLTCYWHEPDRCRPRAGGDPNAVSLRYGVAGETSKVQGLWVPAFAGTTANSSAPTTIEEISQALARG